MNPLRASRRADGMHRLDILVSPATGQDRAAVRAVKKAVGVQTECPSCGGHGKPGCMGCTDSWHHS